MLLANSIKFTVKHNLCTGCGVCESACPSKSIATIVRKGQFAGYFGLYCSGGRTFYLTEHIFKEKGINKKDLVYFAYRDEGCLGSLVAKGINNDTQKPFPDKLEKFLTH